MSEPLSFQRVSCIRMYPLAMFGRRPRLLFFADTKTKASTILKMSLKHFPRRLRQRGKYVIIWNYRCHCFRARRDKHINLDTSRNRLDYTHARWKTRWGSRHVLRLCIELLFSNQKQIATQSALIWLRLLLGLGPLAWGCSSRYRAAYVWKFNNLV